MKDSYTFKEEMSLDEIEEKYGLEVRRDTERAATIWAEKALIEANETWLQKEEKRMFSEMLLFGITYFKSRDWIDLLPDEFTASRKPEWIQLSLFPELENKPTEGK